MNQANLHRLAIGGYRSIRSLVVPISQLIVITGPNGSGKSNFYRALKLMLEIAPSQLLTSLDGVNFNFR